MYIKRNRGPCFGTPVAISRGFSLIELMLAMLIMIIASTTMVQIAANVFRTNTQSIQMIQLSQGMRSAIQLISRDIRRSGFNSDALANFLTTEAISSGVTIGGLDANNTANCLQVQYENLEGEARNAVYRLRVISDVGRVSAHFAANATCATAVSDIAWVDITNPLLSNISTLGFVLNSQLTNVAKNTINGNVIQVGLEQISIVISASLRTNDTVNRSIINEVQIRNQYLTV